jgi:hypothetical protein
LTILNHAETFVNPFFPISFEGQAGQNQDDSSSSGCGYREIPPSAPDAGHSQKSIAVAEILVYLN